LTVVPAGLSGVVQIAAGSTNTVALKSDGTVVAWGRSDLGMNTVPSGLSNVVQVAAGWAHALALLSDGTVVAWGGEYGGRTIVPAGLSGVVQVSAGSDHSVAVKSDGTVVAWGKIEGKVAYVPANLAGAIQSASGESFIAILFQEVRPEVAVEQPVGTGLQSNSAAVAFAANLLSVSSVQRTYTLRNSGLADLSGMALTQSGTNAGEFSVSALSSTTLAAGGNITFTVTFTPGGGGNRTAQLSIASNDANSPFLINFAGFGLSQTVDTDGDGLNDAAEYKMSALGFDWQTSQPALVATLADNANTAGYYTTSQIQALNIGTPLLTQNPATGLYKLTIAVKKSTNLQTFSPMPFSDQQTFINAQGEIEYEFSVPDKAAFFRLESR
jgi:hypothetical protein